MVAKPLYRYLESVLLKFIRTLPTRELSQPFNVIDDATSCILGESTSELPCVLSVLKPIRCEQIYVFSNSDFKLHEYKNIFEGTGALKYFELNPLMPGGNKKVTAFSCRFV